MCPPVSPCRGASIVSRCASCAMHKHFCGWKRLLYGWGMCPLRMETPPLWVGMCSLRMETALLRVGMCPFTDGNAAARTFGRAHRRRPYHFSYGSCHKIAGEGLAADIPRCLSQERCSPPIFCAVYRRKGARRRYSALFIAGKVLAADIPRCLSQENSSPPIIRAVYRRKTVRRR